MIIQVIKHLASETVFKYVISLLEVLAKRTDNDVDDNVVKLIKELEATIRSKN
jgi:hypothetical protein